MLGFLMAICLAVVAFSITAMVCAGAWWCVVQVIKDLESY